MLFLTQDLIHSLSLAKNTIIISEQIFKTLLKKSIAELLYCDKLDSTGLNNSKPDVIKELYAAFLTAMLEFARNNAPRENVTQILTKDCGYALNRVEYFVELYEKNKIKLQIKLGNIGTHLPHVIEVEWKIDYLVKRNTLDESEGPIFRVNLITEEHDLENETKKVGCVKFSCTSQELQDLVYKLKDAVRHYQKIG